MNTATRIFGGLLVSGTLALLTVPALPALADGPCADPSGQCSNNGLVTMPNPSAGNVATDNPTGGNVSVQNPSAGNVNTQNPTATNANVANPTGGNVSVQNPAAGNVNVPAATGGNVTTQNPTASNVTVPVAPPAAPQPCTFVLGFAALASVLPQQVGACSSSEQHNPSNGDALQQTKGGLLVWRKADNWTAFTDGFHTWINGPQGLAERLNTQRFSWEADAAAYPLAPASSTNQPAQSTPAQQIAPAPSNDNSGYCWSCKLIDAGSHRM